MKNILIIAGLGERYYFEPFVSACRSRRLKLYVFDPSRFPANALLSVKMSPAGKVDGYMDVMACERSDFRETRLPISDIHVAWHLREGVAVIDPAKPSLETRFSDNESKATLDSIFSVLACAWVNRKETIHFISSNKLYQQKIARQCGLTVPQTLMGNDPHEAAAFAELQDGLLLKMIGYVQLDEEGRHFIYSQRFSAGEISAHPSAIRYCPIFAQEYVSKRYEHRVMVIGERVLSCRIDSQASKSTAVDWRHYDFDRVEHIAVELPGQIQRKLVRFMKAINLRFGAIDLIETPDRDYVFLEVNPSGQWGWIADLAGLPIPEAVADMLASL